MHRLTSKGMEIFYLRVVLIVVLCWPALGYAISAEPPDAASIQLQMQAMIDILDSQHYKQAVSWGEHVVLCYRLAQQRAPTIFEYYLLDALRQDIGFPRSAVLSVALRGRQRYPTWTQCRDFINQVNVSDFQATQEVVDSARQLGRTSRWQILNELKKMADTTKIDRSLRPRKMELIEPDVQYHTYFGYLHAHSNLSDGEGTALEAYVYARDIGELDFFGLTDHGEYLIIWPWENKWQQLVDAANTTYQENIYATLYGFEWSNPILGHINVINTAEFTNTISTFWITQLYDWLIERPEGFGRFNHPGDYDYLFLEFFHLMLYSDAVPQMVGIENFNGNYGFDEYYYSGNWWWFIPYSYWDVGNLRKWYLGSLGGQDNHDKDWGKRNEFRTAVLAEELTREKIAEAYMNRRFYATEDKNLYLDFRCQGYPMGSRLTGVSREFEVTAQDENGDTFNELRLYRNGNLLQTEPVSGSDIQVSFTDASGSGSQYYYVIVRQDDDNDGNGRNDEAISSPIWIE